MESAAVTFQPGFSVHFNRYSWYTPNNWPGTSQKKNAEISEAEQKKHIHFQLQRSPSVQSSSSPTPFPYNLIEVRLPILADLQRHTPSMFGGVSWSQEKLPTENKSGKGKGLCPKDVLLFIRNGKGNVSQRYKYSHSLGSWYVKEQPKGNIEQKKETIQIVTSLKTVGFRKWWIEDGSYFPFRPDSQLCCESTSVRGSPVWGDVSLQKNLLESKSKTLTTKLNKKDPFSSSAKKTRLYPCLSSKSGKRHLSLPKKKQIDNQQKLGAPRRISHLTLQDLTKAALSWQSDISAREVSPQKFHPRSFFRARPPGTPKKKTKVPNKKKAFMKFPATSKSHHDFQGCLFGCWEKFHGSAVFFCLLQEWAIPLGLPHFGVKCWG